MIPMFTLLLFTLPNVARAEDGCEDDWYVEEQGAYYLEGLGCVVGDISLYCAERFDGDCWSWDQVVARYEDSPPGVEELFAMDCAEGSDYVHRWNRSTSAWQEYLYYDEDGFAVGSFEVTFGDPWCCDGHPATRFYHGDPYATCIEPTDTGDIDTGAPPKTAPCGCATDTGAAAAALLAACSLLTVRRRRQP